ncbi:MAG: DUF5655 domain-containing protein [Bryobacteraceae bacterium]|jgi:hypothetical protein
MAAKAQVKAAFDVHPAVAMAQSVIAGMKEKTGRRLEEWLELVGDEGPATEKERREWLKAKHGLGTNYAGCIAEISVGKGELFSAEGYLRLAGEYVEKMFAGPKAGLRPIYDALLAAGLKLGKDVRVCPCKTMVPLYRNHVFAQIKPAARARIDFGLALKDTKTPKRLIDTGGFAKKDRITRRIEIASVGDIDDEVRRRMKVAYEMDA